MWRFDKNPILSPNSKNSWEALASFNGSVVKDNSSFHLFYRAMSQEQTISGKNLHLSSIGHATSPDGLTFSNRKLFIKPELEWEKFGCEDPRVTKIDNDFFIFYTALSDFPPYPMAIKSAVATFSGFDSPMQRHLVTPFNSKAMALFPEKINGKYVAVLTVNTDIPPSKIALATFETKEEIWDQLYWRRWYQSLEEHVLPLQRVNSDQLEVGAGPVLTEYGWLLIYAHIRNYYTEQQRIFGIEAVLLDKDNPQKIIGRYEEPLLIPQEQYEHEGVVPNIVFPSGALIEQDHLYLYYGAADTHCAVAMMPIQDLLKKMRTTAVVVPKFHKPSENPILEPVPEHSWEAQAVLNSAAFYANNTVHIVYRAMSHDNTSVLGYATSIDGIHIKNRSIAPIYHPRAAFEDKHVKNGNSGCEDPRITQIDDTLYMTYTAFDSISPPRVALSTINVEGFVSNNFSWSEPVLISPPGIDDKDACIFPEKINGKYVIFHRIQNAIVVDYADNLDFNGTNWLKSIDFISPSKEGWDNAKIGISAPPIKTEYGWFLLYHGISTIDHEYRVGAMLLDLEKPANVLARTPYPLMEPEEIFEKEGIVSNVVFPCGTVVMDETLFVYYGGADKVACVATYNFPSLVQYLNELREPKFLLT